MTVRRNFLDLRIHNRLGLRPEDHAVFVPGPVPATLAEAFATMPRAGFEWTHPVMAAAITRFNMFRRMRDELTETKRALEERKVIDRAKGLLMKARGIDEDQAYALLRKTAMDQGKKISDVATALVTAMDLLS